MYPAIKNVSRKDLQRYSLVVFPCNELHKKIQHEINAARKNEGCTSTATTDLLKPHIDCADFLISEEMEATLFRWIQNICNLHTSFSLQLNNYSSLPPSTIYLRILDADPIKKLCNALSILNSFISANNCPVPEVNKKPHLVIATGLSEYEYEKAIKKLSGESFHEMFHVDKLVMVKKDISGRCSVINTFTLPAAPFLYE